MVRLAILLTLTALAAGALVPAESGAAPWRATVGVFDDFFKPRSVTVRRGGVVTWRWRGSSRHNVALFRPRSSRRVRRSSVKRRGRFSHRFRRLGRWRALCQLHPGMRMTVTVRRR